MAKRTEYRLSKAAQRPVLMLGQDQARLLNELQEVQEALADLARRYAGDHGWTPEDGTGVYFEMQNGQIVLVIAPGPEGEPVPEADPPQKEELDG